MRGAARKGSPYRDQKIQLKKTSAKKTRGGRRRFVEGLEEDAAEEDCIFRPAQLPENQNDADNIGSEMRFGRITLRSSPGFPL